jgi:hypothetical protein
MLAPEMAALRTLARGRMLATEMAALRTLARGCMIATHFHFHTINRRHDIWA